MAGSCWRRLLKGPTMPDEAPQTRSAAAKNGSLVASDGLSSRGSCRCGQGYRAGAEIHRTCFPLQTGFRLYNWLCPSMHVPSLHRKPIAILATEGKAMQRKAPGSEIESSESDQCRTQHVSAEFSSCLAEEKRYRCDFAFLFGDEYLCAHPNHRDFR